MTKSAILLLTMFLVFSGCATKPNVKLVLKNRWRTVRKGTLSELELNIIGADVFLVTGHDKNFNLYQDQDKATFTRKLSIRPQKEGFITFGLYSLRFNGKRLISNEVSIKVLPEWDGKYGYKFNTNTESIILGDKFELIIERWNKRNESYENFHSNFRLNINNIFTADSTGYMHHGVGEAGYSRLSWLITPKQVGPFHITKELFSKIPEGVQIPIITVIVNKPAQQDAAPDGTASRSRG